MWLYVRGVRWRVASDEGLPEDQLGLCDYAKKTIYVPIDGWLPHELDTVIHEALHACYPDMSEAAVEEGAGTLSALLIKLGWTKDELTE